MVATWSKVSEYNMLETFETTLSGVDSSSELLGLDHTKEMVVAIKTTGSAVTAVHLTQADPRSGTPEEFIYAINVATAEGVDWVKGALGPFTGIKLVGTLSGGTVLCQVTQSPEK